MTMLVGNTAELQELLPQPAAPLEPERIYRFHQARDGELVCLWVSSEGRYRVFRKWQLR